MLAKDGCSRVFDVGGTQGDRSYIVTREIDIVIDDAPRFEEINDNRYYWQWREGNKLKSKYKAPVSPDE